MSEFHLHKYKDGRLSPKTYYKNPRLETKRKTGLFFVLLGIKNRVVFILISEQYNITSST